MEGGGVRLLLRRGDRKSDELTNDRIVIQRIDELTYMSTDARLRRPESAMDETLMAMRSEVLQAGANLESRLHLKLQSQYLYTK